MKIMLDPGHGGSDPGATANNIIEKEVNLAVALLARDLLTASGVNVIMTRMDDTYVSLPDRTERANREKVDAFVSIHHNAALRVLPGVWKFITVLSGARASG